MEVTKEWLEENGFIYFTHDDSYHLIIDNDEEQPQVRYHLKDNWLFVNRWDARSKGSMSYFNFCPNTEKINELLKVFDIWK